MLYSSRSYQGCTGDVQVNPTHTRKNSIALKTQRRVVYKNAGLEVFTEKFK